MINQDSFSRLTLGEALERLPGPQGEQSVLLFEHGSLVVKLYAPRGSDPQTPHSLDETYVVAQGLSAAERDKPSPRMMFCSWPRESNTVLKTSLMILRSGFSFMGRKAARQIEAGKM